MSMDEVRVSKADLLATLMVNLEKHQTEINDLFQLRREDVVETFLETIKDIEGDINFAPEESYNFPSAYDHTRDYKRTIKMLKMSLDDDVKLTTRQFEMFVLDEWDWKHELSTANAFYSSKSNF